MELFAISRLGILAIVLVVNVSGLAVNVMEIALINSFMLVGFCLLLNEIDRMTIKFGFIVSFNPVYCQTVAIYNVFFCILFFLV